MGLTIEGLKQHESCNPNRGVTGIAVFLKEKGEPLRTPLFIFRKESK